MASIDVGDAVKVLIGIGGGAGLWAVIGEYIRRRVPSREQEASSEVAFRADLLKRIVDLERRDREREDEIEVWRSKYYELYPKFVALEERYAALEQRYAALEQELERIRGDGK